MHRIAVLTSGGDAPGMNYAVVSIARAASHLGMQLIGVIRGNNGLIRKDTSLFEALFRRAREVIGNNQEDLSVLASIEKAVQGRYTGSFDIFRPFIEKYAKDLCLFEDFNAFLQQNPIFQKDFINLDMDTMLDIVDRPGTHLRTARCEDFKNKSVQLVAALNLIMVGIEGVITIGGDGTFKGAMGLTGLGMPCVGIPCTIDNDLKYTEMTLGFDTAVNVCLQSVRQIRATSRSHDRPHVVEVMGRDAGDIALRTAMASGAEIVIVPEQPWSIEEVAQKLQKQIDMGNTRATIIVAEGAYAAMAPFDVYGFLIERGKVCYQGETISSSRLASILKRMCKDADGKLVEVRATVLGYTQRGESPSAYDAAFAFEAGHMAVRLLSEGKKNVAIQIQNGKVSERSFEEVMCLQESRTDFFNHTSFTLVNTISEPFGQNEDA